MQRCCVALRCAVLLWRRCPQDLTVEQFVSLSWRLHEQTAAQLGSGGGELAGLQEEA